MAHRRLDLADIRLVTKVKDVEIRLGEALQQMWTGGIVVIDPDQTVERVKDAAHMRVDHLFIVSP